MIGERLHVDLPKDSPFGKLFDTVSEPPTDFLVSGKKSAEVFTWVVNDLRHGIFHAKHDGIPRWSHYSLEGEMLKDLAALLWELVGNKVTPFGVTAVETLSFYADSHGVGVIVVPPLWYQLYLDDPIYQTGAVFFAASQAQDFWNDKLIDAALMQNVLRRNMLCERAYAHEAQFLLRIQELFVTWRPNEYQKHVLDDFPKGVESLIPEFVYTSRKWDGPSA